jgi:uncharacterized protein YraI
MRRSISHVLISYALALTVTAATLPPAEAAGWNARHEVYGVDEDDMLKLRSGPGTGFTVILGLPNGTQLRVIDCERAGHVQWCKVALGDAPTLRGYVSGAYIRER